jgi:organic hydroperoxide reductase OsmC/OhrA
MPPATIPRELLVGSLASCHMLWYLHLCADAGVTVLAYRDEPVVEDSAKGGHFTKVVLRPRVALARCRRGQGPRPAPERPRKVLHRQLGQFPCDLRA